jgi:serine protease
MLMHSTRLAVLMILVALGAPSVVVGAEYNPVAHPPRTEAMEAVAGVIVKLRAAPSGTTTQKLNSMADRGARLAKRTGLAIEMRREIGPSTFATRIGDGVTINESLARLRADPEVEYAVPDHRRYALATNPNDPLFAGQWYLKDTEVSAINAINAWDRELGASGVVIAVLDTGVLFDHPDLGRTANGGKLLPGFDFVSDTAVANDGGGRDADASDPGDWVDSSDQANAQFANCDLGDSSWHGTRVAGMIAALTNNGSGVAGIDWNSRILPVRVLGKCGGLDSDIITAMRWAAGIHVNGVPDNPNPARILNMSLGSTSTCEASYLDAVQELTARKVVIVIAAGNEGTMVSSPANCGGVASVAAIRHAGSKVGFSNLGPEVTIAAPGGNCVNINGGACLFSLDTTSNSGLTVPASHNFTDQFNSNLGTSFSTPIVAGVAALMISRNNNLSTSQILARLREGARPFPTTVADAPTIQACHVPANTQDFQLEQCLCTTDTCGAGMVDATNALNAAERPIAAIAPPANVFPGQTVSLSASGSAAACGNNITGFAWTVVSPATNPPAIVGADTATASVNAPMVGTVTLRLTVTDDQGRTDSADVQIDANRANSSAPASAGSNACPAGTTPPPAPTPLPPPPTPTPAPSPTPFPPSGNGGGGGGSLELLTLTLLGGLWLARTRRARRTRFARCN